MLDGLKDLVSALVPSPLAGEGKDEGAVQLTPSPQSSPVEGEEAETANPSINWPVRLGRITNQASRFAGGV